MKGYWASEASSVRMGQLPWVARMVSRFWNYVSCRVRLPNPGDQPACIMLPSFYQAERIWDEPSYVWLRPVWRLGRVTTSSAKHSISLILMATVWKYTGIGRASHGTGPKTWYRWQPIPSMCTD